MCQLIIDTIPDRFRMNLILLINSYPSLDLYFCEILMLKTIALFAVLVSFLLYPGEQLHAQESAPQLEFRLADDTETTGWQKMEVRGSDKTVFVSNEVSLHGGHIEKVSFYKDLNGNPSVGLTLTEDGAKVMKETTSKNQNKKLAILLNGKVINAPTIRSTIAKEVQITGRFDKDDLLTFFHAIVLRELPASDG
ncbi:preprotein translocase subunit SecD [Gimesia maris]|uniref:Preprotein translocase subunit SecD n=2 Tax=Gimesia maris TaxID=122 RepID=A0ABX5YUK9_9PLAN|nr:preprotein translocase subunit SecD [Gimesia maris]